MMTEDLDPRAVIERLATVDVDGADRQGAATALASVGRVRAWLDALGRVLRRLEPPQRENLLARSDRLLQEAQSSTVEDYARYLRRTACRFVEHDAEARLARQRRDRRCRTWVDPDSGMWHLSARFDPETGVRLQHHLDAALATLFTDRTPEGCPADPGEKQDHLRALALTALIDGPPGGSLVGRAGRAEPVVVIDTSSSGAPDVDWGLPVELPVRVLEQLFGVRDAAAVVVRNGVVLHAPGCWISADQRVSPTEPSAAPCAASTPRVPSLAVL